MVAIRIVVRMERVRATIVVAVIAVVLAAFPPVDAGAVKAIENCLAETGTSKDDLMTFMRTGEASHNLQCVLSCALKAVKFLKADGTLDGDYMKSLLPSFTASTIDSCIDKAKSTGGDICNVAFTFNKCFLDAERKIFMEFVSA